MSGAWLQRRTERGEARAMRARFALGLLVAACSSERAIAPPPAAPQLDEPQVAIPADLDLVLRADLKRIRAALGMDAAAPLLEGLSQRAPRDEPDGATAELGRKLLLAADTIWVGVRPGLAAELTDSVVILRGDFRALVPSELGGEPPWGPAEDLGGAVRRFTRPAPRLRSSPAVLYVAGSELAVLGSFAEIDALERSLEQGHRDAALRAPEHGLVSVAMRVPPLRRALAARSPTLARLIDGVRTLEGSADHDGVKLRLRVDLALEDAERARALSAGLERLRSALASPARPWLERAEVKVLAQDVALTLDLSSDELKQVVRCWQRADC